MAVTEESRHEMHQCFDGVFGPQVANTLMEHLPPVGWADVATKRDLDQFEGRMAARFEVIESRFEVIESRFEVVESRFRVLECRFEAALQRGLRVNLAATLGGVGVLLALVEFAGR